MLKRWKPNNDMIRIRAAIESHSDYFRRFIFVLVCGLMTSCGSTSLTVTGNYPSPLTSRLPMTATLLLDEEFREYVATPSDNVTMKMGDAQTAMMENVLSERFVSLTVVTEVPDEIHTDILIKATVAGVQVGTPTETHLAVFEVWIKYNLEISDNSNELIAKWFMPAYGKTPSAFMTSDAKAINSAAQFALRDAGVRLITDLHRIPEFRYWIKQREKLGKQVFPESKKEGKSPPDLGVAIDKSRRHDA